MEVSMFPGFTDMGMMNDLSFFHHQLQVNSLEELFINNYDQAMTNQAFSYNYKRSAQTDDVHTPEEKPIKQLKTNHWSHNNINPSYEINNVLNSQNNDLTTNSTMLSFSNNSSSCSNQTNSSLLTPKEEVAISNVSFPSNLQQASSVDKQFEASPPRGVVNKSANVGCVNQQSRDHIMAERKRREKLSQKFIALSAIIPGLKKVRYITVTMDKASVLGDAIKYVKQLQERVAKLEGETKKKTVESAVIVNRSYVSAEEDEHFISGQTTFSSSSCDSPFPEIEAKFSDNDVLIKIHCENKKGVFEKVISKIEELNLAVSSSSSLAFGGSTLAVTVIAQMNADFSMTTKDVVKHIHTTVKCLT
ncbi:Transcription factor bHLH25 [Bienertia sinuspersici]